MDANELLVILLCVLLAASLTEATASCSRFVRSSGPVNLDPTVSSDVISEASSASVQDCLLRCRMRGCVAVSLLQSSLVCQQLFIKDASQTAGMPGSHVWRSFGAESDAVVWTAVDIDSVIQMKRINITIQFFHISTGRLGITQQLSVNFTGCYRIDAWGASGGSNSFTGKAGGNGAFMSGRFNLTAGVQLSILVGQAGGPAVNGSCGGGGGGGSFVFVSGTSHLLLAAGGGGGASFSRIGDSGQAGVNGSDSSAGSGNKGFGGANGDPGYNDPTSASWICNIGGCGAGWLGRPLSSRRSASDGDRGGSFAENWTGGLAGNSNTGDGGFGGGGGAGGIDNAKTGAAGAGGGFSGGGAGVGIHHAGGGGGSYCDGLDCVGVTGGNGATQQGRVTLRLLSYFC